MTSQSMRSPKTLSKLFLVLPSGEANSGIAAPGLTRTQTRAIPRSAMDPMVLLLTLTPRTPSKYTLLSAARFLLTVSRGPWPYNQHNDGYAKQGDHAIHTHDNG